MEIRKKANWKNWTLGKMIFGETGNWEKRKFGKIKILETVNLEIGNLEK